MRFLWKEIRDAKRGSEVRSVDFGSLDCRKYLNGWRDRRIARHQQYRFVSRPILH